MFLPSGRGGTRKEKTDRGISIKRIGVAIVSTRGGGKEKISTGGGRGTRVGGGGGEHPRILRKRNTQNDLKRG